MERYADYKTHCLHEIGWANAGVTTPIPLWVRNTGQPVDVPWFRWELSNRVPSSCRIHWQDPLHTTGWESLTNGWYTIIPKDKVKAESLLITEHSSHTSMCINNTLLFLAYQSINWWQNSVHIYWYWIMTVFSLHISTTLHLTIFGIWSNNIQSVQYVICVMIVRGYDILGWQYDTQ